MPSDPYTTLREALERIAAGPRPGGRWTAFAAQKIAREALAAAPEPEWEYRVGVRDSGDDVADYDPSEVFDTSVNARALAERIVAANVDDPYAEVFIECRRKAGEWERVPDDE